MPFPNLGNKRLWTRETVLGGLALAATEIRGPLPCCDRPYNALKKGHLTWPTSRRILEYFGSMAAGWLAAGAPRKRITFNNLPWREDEEVYLLEHAGDDTLVKIGESLRRSYGAVRKRLQGKGITARGNNGFFSAGELAREYDCSYQRVRNLLKSGVIQGRFDEKRNRWQVDLKDITPAAKALLRAPKMTYTTRPTDKGDYCKRHGIRRHWIVNKIVRVKEAVVV